jgi:hypothetical protein
VLPRALNRAAVQVKLGPIELWTIFAELSQTWNLELGTRNLEPSNYAALLRPASFVTFDRSDEVDSNSPT